MFCSNCGYFLNGKGAPSPEKKSDPEEELDEDSAPEEEDGSDDEPKRRMSGISIAGFVLSLVSLLVLPLVLGIIGLIFSAIGLGTTGAEKKRGKGFAVAGFIVSIVSICWTLLSCVACLALI